MEITISKSDAAILREVAKQQLYYANQESNKKKIEQWYLHNALKGEKPMIHLELDTFREEVIPQRLKCQGEFARQAEEKLYCNFLNQELFMDDRVTPDCYELGIDTFFTLFGLDIQVDHTKDSKGEVSLGHHFASLVQDLEEDYGKLGNSRYSVDMDSTMCKKKILEEAFGDILPVELTMNCLYSVPTQMLVHFMSMENMMFNICDYPTLFLEMMDRIAEDTLAYYRYLEEKQMILPTVGHSGLGQGSFCYTRQLPQSELDAKRPLTTKDVWGFMDSQETVGISPDMYEEFIFPCYQKIASQFGLLSYGCCEPVDPIWDNCISKLDNLRKVSISPWCKEEFMGERLRGSKVIYHRKPSPNFLGVGAVLDESGLRSHIRKSLQAARGCKMEITQRDVYTIHHDVEKARRYVDIIRDEIDRYWKG